MIIDNIQYVLMLWFQSNCNRELTLFNYRYRGFELLWIDDLEWDGFLRIGFISIDINRSKTEGNRLDWKWLRWLRFELMVLLMDKFIFVRSIDRIRPSVSNVALIPLIIFVLLCQIFLVFRKQHFIFILCKGLWTHQNRWLQILVFTQDIIQILVFIIVRTHVTG